MTLLVCRTCPRYDIRRTGSFGAALVEAISADWSTVVRQVQCLGGCPRDGVVALDSPGKARVRFADVCVDDASAIVVAAARYDRCPSGYPGDWDVPSTLVDRVSSVTVKRHGPTP